MSDQDDSLRTDHDSPWKMALESYFQEFLALLFPAINDQVDWFEGRIRWDTTKPDGTPRKPLDVSRLNALGFQTSIPLEKGLEKGLEDASRWFLGYQADCRGRFKG